MRRRSTASGQPAKSRRRKAITLKRRNARKANQAPSRSASSAETKIAQLTRERDEALEQQRALRISGYAAPAQVEIVGRAAEGDPARIVPLVGEVIAKNVSVIMASGPLALNAARSAARTIPVVAIDFETDPIASGVAASLARPGS